MTAGITPRPFNTEVKDLRGKKFGRLTVIEFSHVKKFAYWKCLCECGSEKVAPGYKLINGDTKSCGCFRREASRLRVLTHGKTNTYLFVIWGGIKTRLFNTSDHNYPNYGGRGISMFTEWKDDFDAFEKYVLEFLGERPSPRHSIDRIDNNGNYWPGNIKWSTPSQQGRNKRNNHLVLYDGQMRTLAELTEIAGFRKNTIRNRLVAGMKIEDAMVLPENEKVLRRIRRRTLNPEIF